MAAYSPLDLDGARQIGSLFGLDVTDIEAVPGGMTNSSFLVHASKAPYMVTILDDHDVASAEALADLVHHLTAAGLSTPEPMRTPSGAPLVWWDAKPVMVKPFVIGSVVSPLPARHLGELGAYLARVHLVPPPATVPVGGRELPPDWKDHLGVWDRTAMVDLLSVVAPMPDAWTHLPIGLVHGDVFDDNVLVTPDDHLVVLDWETAAVEPLVLDLGMSAVGVCRTDNRLDRARLDAFLAGYDTVRVIGQDEHDALLDATAYAAGLLAYNRYVRHRVHRPDDTKEHLYREMLDFSNSLH